MTEPSQKQNPPPQDPADTIAPIAFGTDRNQKDTEEQPDKEPPTDKTAEVTPWWKRHPPDANEKEIGAAAAISLGGGMVTDTKVPIAAETTAEKVPPKEATPDSLTVPDAVPYDESTATEIVFGDDGKAATTDVAVDDASEKNDSHEARSSVQDTTFVSTLSESDGDSDKSPPTNRRLPASNIPSHLGVYFIIVFILVSAAVLVPLALFTDIFTKGSNTSSQSGGGLPIPTPVPSHSPSLTGNTLAPGETIAPVVIAVPTSPPTPTPTASPTTQAPTLPGATPFPTAWPTPEPTPSPTASPTTALPTARPTPLPTGSPTPEPTPSPTATPTSFPTETPTKFPTRTPTSTPSGSPSASPSMAPVDITSTPLFSYLITLGTPADVLTDPTTPQGRAFRWLLQPTVEQISVFRVPQRYALVALDYALHASDTTSSSSSVSWRREDADICDWQGVTCDTNSEVTEVKWSSQRLAGGMIPEIKLLNKLEKVDLAENEITGTLDSFWDLPELTHLYLFSNKFSGTIPSDRSAPSGLQRVYLGSNQLTGPLPLTLASSTSGPAALSKYCRVMRVVLQP